MENSVDRRHGDMRLDIEDMSYEASGLEIPSYNNAEHFELLEISHVSVAIGIRLQELLALGEQIGNVNTGVTEETIATLLKTKSFEPLTTTNLEEAASEDEEIDPCIICLVLTYFVINSLVM